MTKVIFKDPTESRTFKNGNLRTSNWLSERFPLTYIIITRGHRVSEQSICWCCDIEHQRKDTKPALQERRYFWDEPGWVPVSAPPDSTTVIWCLDQPRRRERASSPVRILSDGNGPDGGDSSDYVTSMAASRLTRRFRSLSWHILEALTGI